MVKTKNNSICLSSCSLNKNSKSEFFIPANQQTWLIPVHHLHLHKEHAASTTT